MHPAHVVVRPRDSVVWSGWIARGYVCKTKAIQALWGVLRGFPGARGLKTRRCERISRGPALKTHRMGEHILVHRLVTDRHAPVRGTGLDKRERLAEGRRLVGGIPGGERVERLRALGGDIARALQTCLYICHCANRVVWATGSVRGGCTRGACPSTASADHVGTSWGCVRFEIEALRTIPRGRRTRQRRDEVGRSLVGVESVGVGGIPDAERSRWGCSFRHGL